MALQAGSGDGTVAPAPIANGPGAKLVSGVPDYERRAQWQTAFEGNRDQWQRPKIVKPNGKEWGYRRASSFGSPLEYEGGLTTWKMRQVARGVTHSETLQAEIARAEVHVDGPSDDEATKRAKSALNDLCESAMKEVGSDEKARIGTAMHAVYERHDLGVDPGFVPASYRADLDAYRALVDGRFRTVSAEEIIVEDEFEVAGTYDRCLECLRDEPIVIKGETVATLPVGTIILGDVKTSQSTDFAGPKWACQTREYAFGTPWNPVTRERIAWEDDEGRHGWGHAAPSRTWAAILHVPSGQGVASILWVNLAEASVACVQVMESYAWRGRRGKALITAAVETVERTEDFTVTAATVTTLDELRDAATRANAAGRWDDDLRAVFSTRKAELAGGPVAVPA